MFLVKCFALNFQSALWSRQSPVVMNCTERFSYPRHQQIAIRLRCGSSHKLWAGCTFGKSMACLSPWLTDSDGGRERRLPTDGGGGLSRPSQLCLRDGALSSPSSIIHQSSAPPLGPPPICCGSVSICRARPCYIWYAERGEVRGEQEEGGRV